jgi:ABC-type transporter Mla MlaB component
VPANDAGVEALPAVVDETAAAALFRAWRPRLTQIAGFDLGAVREIDSAGVALLRAVQAAQRAAGGPVATLRAVPERYRALCLAHRLPLDG